VGQISLTISEQILVLETLISERALIIYVIESDLMDNKLVSKDYKMALKDEIKNHKLAIKGYKSDLKKLKSKINAQLQNRVVRQ
jgi:hypothetical protein